MRNKQSYDISRESRLRGRVANFPNLWSKGRKFSALKEANNAEGNHKPAKCDGRFCGVEMISESCTHHGHVATVALDYKCPLRFHSLLRAPPARDDMWKRLPIVAAPAKPFANSPANWLTDFCSAHDDVDDRDRCGPSQLVYDRFVQHWLVRMNRFSWNIDRHRCNQIYTVRAKENEAKWFD